MIFKKASYSKSEDRSLWLSYSSILSQLYQSQRQAKHASIPKGFLPSFQTSLWAKLMQWLLNLSVFQQLPVVLSSAAIFQKSKEAELVFSPLEHIGAFLPRQVIEKPVSISPMGGKSLFPPSHHLSNLLLVFHVLGSFLWVPSSDVLAFPNAFVPCSCGRSYIPWQIDVHLHCVSAVTCSEWTACFYSVGQAWYLWGTHWENDGALSPCFIKHDSVTGLLMWFQDQNKTLCVETLRWPGIT